MKPIDATTREGRAEALEYFKTAAKEFFTDTHGVVLREWDESKFQRDRYYTGQSPRNYFLAFTRRKYEPQHAIDIGAIQNWAEEVHRFIVGYMPVIEVRESFIRIGLKRE